MSLNLCYSFREGVAGLRRARLATTITVSTVAITLTLLGIFLILTVNVQRIVDLFRERMTLEVFIDNSLGSDQIRELKKNISSVQGVEKVVFISPQEALEQFRKEFGEDPLEVLGENPLPPSFQLKLRRDQCSPDGAERLVRRLDKLEGIDEVVYHGKLFRIVDRYSHIVFLADGTLFFIVLLSAILLVANTLRLTILSQRETIQIMELVGATKGFIKRPYLIQGILQGGIGGGLGSLIVWGLVKVVTLRFPHFIDVSIIVVLTPFFLGLLLSYLGSRVGLRRFLRHHKP